MPFFSLKMRFPTDSLPCHWLSESTLHLAALESPLEPRVALVVENPEGVLVRFEETFRTILFVLDSIALAVVQVAFLYHQKCLSATMT